MKNIKSIKQFSWVALAVISLFAGCVKDEFDTPPVNSLPVGDVLTIDQLRDTFALHGAFDIVKDYSTYGVVSMDESTGNIYKTVYIKDAVGACDLHFTSTSGLKIGDSVRVYLKGCKLSEYSGLFQIDNVKADSNIVIISNGNAITPVVTTIEELMVDMTGNGFRTFEGKLIQLESVQFADGELGETYADEPNQQSKNRMLENCNKKSLIVRTSGYSSFAGEPVAIGNGTFIGIASRFNNDIQLLIRSLDEVQLTGERCTNGGGGVVLPYIQEFETNLGDFSQFSVNGSQVWKWAFYNGGCALMSGYEAPDRFENEDWLISPVFDLTDHTDTRLVVNQAASYVFDKWDYISIMVSKDYTGEGDPNVNGTWVDLNWDGFEKPTGNSFDFVSTGDIDLSDYDGEAGFYVAFRYKSTTDVAASWEIGSFELK